MAVGRYVIVFERRGEKENWKKAKKALKAAGICSMKSSVWDDADVPSPYPMDAKHFENGRMLDTKIYTIRVQEEESDLAYSIILQLFPDYQPYIRADGRPGNEERKDLREPKERRRNTITIVIAVIVSAVMLTSLAVQAVRHARERNGAEDMVYHYRVSEISNWSQVDDAAVPESYAQFTRELDAGRVKRVFAEFDMGEYSQTMYYTLRKDKDKLYRTANPDSPDFKERLLQKGADVQPKAEVFNQNPEVTKVKPEVVRNFSRISFLVPLTAIALFFLFLSLWLRRERMRQMENSRREDASGEKKDAEPKSFDQIGGLHPLKKDLKVVVDFLQNPEKYRNAGADLPRGILLYGPPGTGKTLIAKVMASEAQVGFVYANASDFVEKYVGTGAARIRDLFKRARKEAPCIVFIDEIDTIASKRSSDMNSEDRKALTALLTEMDGFRKSDNILVIGATNRMDDMDEAVLRPGRFSDIFAVPVPETIEDRLEIIDIYAKGKTFEESFDRRAFAEEMMGRSPAEIRDVLNEAAILSVQKGLAAITKECIETAFYKRLLHGHQTDNAETDERDLKLIAYHEAGHALVARLCGSRVSKITILGSTSGAGGVTFVKPSERKLYTKRMMENKICEMYGGKVAEYLISGRNWDNTTQGCSNDIQKATQLLKDMVDAYGMGGNGMVNLNMLSRETSEKSTEYITEMSRKLQERTVRMMERHGDLLEKLARALLEENTIYEPEIDRIVGEAAGTEAAVREQDASPLPEPAAASTAPAL